MNINMLRRTKYSDDGYVFEAPAPSLFQRSVRIYLVGPRTELFGLNTQIDQWRSQVDDNQLTVHQVMLDLRKVSGRIKQHPTRHTLVPFRTTYRFEIVPSNYGAI